jgi:hypothetical protein
MDASTARHPRRNCGKVLTGQGLDFIPFTAITVAGTIAGIALALLIVLIFS